MAGVLTAPLREAVYVAPDAGLIPAAVTLSLGQKQVYLYPGEAAVNFTLNLTSVAGSDKLASLMGIGESISAAVFVGMGNNAREITSVSVDGTLQTVQWLNSTKTTATNKLNIISLTVIKTGGNTTAGVWTVIGSVAAAGVPA
jgi:hypothetical protein